MTPFQNSTGAVIGINMNLLVACVSGWGAWAIWPGTPEWWGLGVLAVILATGAIAGLVNALRAIGALYARDRVLAAYMAQGSAPKSARMASHADLKRAGMLDE